MSENWGKDFYRSKTFWFGGLVILVSIAGLFGFQEYQPPADLVEGIGAGLGLAVIILRFWTKEPINKG